MKSVKLVCVAVLILIGAAVTAEALSYSSTILHETLPADLRMNAKEDTTHIFLFEESTLTLGSALTVDLLGPAFTGSGDIASGIEVSSWLLHFDPVGGPDDYSTFPSVTGTVTFDTEILGVFYIADSLDATDATLGMEGPLPGGTVYDKFRDRRRLELGTGSEKDVITFSGGTVLTVDMKFAAAHIDELRVVTRAAEGVSPNVPDGGATLALLGLALGALGLRRSGR